MLCQAACIHVNDNLIRRNVTLWRLSIVMYINSCTGFNASYCIFVTAVISFILMSCFTEFGRPVILPGCKNYNWEGQLKWISVSVSFYLFLSCISHFPVFFTINFVILCLPNRVASVPSYSWDTVCFLHFLRLFKPHWLAAPQMFKQMLKLHFQVSLFSIIWSHMTPNANYLSWPNKQEKKQWNIPELIQNSPHMLG